MKKIILLLASLFLVTGCNSKKSPYDPYASRDTRTIPNIYSGDKQDFHLNSWYPSDVGEPSVTEEIDQTIVTYTKTYDKNYTSVYTPVMGPLADFTYINLVARGTPGKNVTMRMYYGSEEKETNNVLGNDIGFSLNEQFSIHSLKVKGTLKTRMDLRIHITECH